MLKTAHKTHAAIPLWFHAVWLRAKKMHQNHVHPDRSRNLLIRWVRQNCATCSKQPPRTHPSLKARTSFHAHRFCAGCALWPLTTSSVKMNCAALRNSSAQDASRRSAIAVFTCQTVPHGSQINFTRVKNRCAAPRLLKFTRQGLLGRRL